MSEKKPKKAKQPRTREEKLARQKKNRKIVNTIMGVIIFCVLLAALSGVSTIALILQKSDVVLDVKDLGSSELSFIYDDAGNEVYSMGKEDRINIDYDDLPQCVVDAFVAVEDSRFFEHSGFDLPRFAKAFLENIKSMSFSQGGSTITMQVIKNSYFAVDTLAAREGGAGVSRKVQEIYYAIKISQLVSKGKILDLYVNKINYGANARGLEVASEYYFNKPATELTLVEAAMLAGVVNAPNAYNPYYHPTACQQRTEEVLYQMYHHGYLTEEEYDLAKKVRVIDLIYGNDEKTYGEGTTIPNQAYIDVVLNELENTYDIDGYSTPVRVYTGLNQSVQSYLDAVSNGTAIDYQDQYINYACAVVQNYTGLIVGIDGGRNYDTVRGFNYAVDGRMQPGSTIKSLLSYPLAFEYTGLATSSYITDEPIAFTGTSTRIQEESGRYYGEVSIQNAFCTSYNVPAVKLLRKVEAAIGEDGVKSYLRQIGFDESVVNNFNEQFAIGGADCLVSPLQLAAAGSAILSEGKYTTPHTITRIEFINDDKEPIVASYQSVQVLSAGAAYLDSRLMRMNVSHGYATEHDFWGNGRVTPLTRSYPMYAKTGTTSLPYEAIANYGMPNAGAKDQWLLVGSRKFTVAGWIGYDYSNHIDSSCYISFYDRSFKRDTWIMAGIFNTLENVYGAEYNDFSQPSDVTSITHIRGLEPFTALPSYADKSYQTSGLILTKFASVASYVSPSNISSVSSLTATANTDGKSIDIAFSPYPDASKLTTAPAQLTMTYGGRTWTGAKVYDSTWIDGVIQYHVLIRDEEGNVLDQQVLSSPQYTYSLGSIPTTDRTLTVEAWYAYSVTPLESERATAKVTIKGIIPIVPDPDPGTDPGTDPGGDETPLPPDPANPD